MWKLFNLAKTFGKLPNEALGNSLANCGDWEVYQFNSAVFAFGRMVENELAKARRKASKGRKVKAERVEAAVKDRLHKLLFPTAKPTYAPLAGRVEQVVKIKPGDDPVKALLQ